MLMKLKKKSLVSISMEIPALGADAEGKLRGGFGALVSNRVDLMSNNGNCNCNCSCSTNNNCNCNCSCGSNGNCNCKCTSSTTTKPSNNTNTSSSMHSIFFDSFMF